MLKETPMFIPILPEFTPKWKVEVIHGSTTTDVTVRVRRGEFTRRLFSLGIGQFSLKLNNPGNVYSGLIEKTDTVVFYADYTSGATQLFKGIIDSIGRDNKGNILEIEGRHIAYLITEKWASKATSAQTAYTIVTDLATTYFPTYTTTNVSTSVTTAITKNWDSQQVLKIFQDAGKLASADGYVDDDLDIHLFPENSTFNENFAIVQGVNLIRISGFGIDNYDLRTKVTIIGQDGEGLPVLYTSGTGSRNERPIFNSNITDVTQAKELGDAKLTELQNEIPQGKTVSYGVLGVNLGDNIIVSAPKQEIHDAYKVIQIKDLIGRENGYWKSECLFERKMQNIADIVENRIRKEDELVKLQNPNNLEYSFNLTFDDSGNIESLTDTEITQSRLQLTSGKTTGIMVTTSQSSLSGNNTSQVELKIIGSNLTSSVFEVSVDNGITYTTVTKDTLYSMVGKYIKVRVTLNLDTTNPNPLLESLCLLYI